jgi:myosin heavy subunit
VKVAASHPGSRYVLNCSKSIQKIVANTSLQPATKIQADLRAILGYYARRIQKGEAARQATIREHEEFAQSANQFLLDLSIAVSDQPASPDCYTRPETLAQIVNSVTQLLQDLDNARHERDELRAITAHFAEAFNSTGADPISAIDNLKRFVLEQHTHAAKRVKELKAVRRENAALARTLDEVKAEHAAHVEELNAETDRIAAEFNAFREEAATVAAEKARALKELETANRTIKLLESHGEPQRCVTDSSEQIASLQGENADLLRQKQTIGDDGRSEQNRLCQLVEKQDVAMVKLQEQLAESREKLARTTKALAECTEVEKVELKTTHEAVFAQLRKELENQRTDLQHVSQLLSETQAASENLRASNEQLAKQNRKLKTDLQATRSTIAKEKKLSDLSAVATRVTVENEFTQKLDELKTRTEADKRRLYGFGAESFKRFFNPLAELDEKSFRYVVH